MKELTLTPYNELTVPSWMRLVKFAIKSGNKHKLINIHERVVILPHIVLGALSPYLQKISTAFIIHYLGWQEIENKVRQA